MLVVKWLQFSCVAVGIKKASILCPSDTEKMETSSVHHVHLHEQRTQACLIVQKLLEAASQKKFEFFGQTHDTCKAGEVS